MSKQRLAILIAASVGALATFMPWASVLGMSVNGTRGDGWITFVFFAAIIAIALFWGQRESLLEKKQTYVAAALGAVPALIGIWKVIDFQNALSGSQADMKDNPFASLVSAGVRIEFGVYLLILAGLAVAVISLFLYGGVLAKYVAKKPNAVKPQAEPRNE